MKNELLHLGPITIYGYGLMIAVGIIAAYFMATYRAKRMKLNSGNIINLTLWVVVGGIAGAKILYIITDMRKIFMNPGIILDVSNGFVVYGGIIGGILTGFLYCRKAKLSFMQYFDLIIPSVALAQGFGRIGCFLAGCCYGLETSSNWGITFHHSEYAPNGVSLIPTQLMSSGLDFMNFFVLILIAKYKKADGQVAGFYLIFYSTGRFLMEFLRGDLIRGSIGALSTSQFISVFTVILGLFLVLKTKIPKKSYKENQV
jgi:phosphatidylglycerol:prolipoprotein diacylglycerol transferase